jgi:hypothetical protein
MSVGMPAALYLEEFGSKVWDAFDHTPYLVGSALVPKGPYRDVDVRVMLDDETWIKWFPDIPPDSDESIWHRTPKWVALTMAFSELGRSMTGLPIDFQIQPSTYANKEYSSPEHSRSALGLVPHRWAKPGSP